jgi:hypothetical protein
MPNKLKVNDLSTYVALPNQANIAEEDRVLFRTLPHPQYADTLLIVAYSPRRAKKDKEDRERLIEKLKRKLSNSSDKGSIKKLINNAGYKKYANIQADALFMLNP